MNSNIELYVNGPSSGTTQGQIELFGDEPISLTISNTDIKDISKRNSSYSQSFVAPATKNNNQLFNHIFNIGSDSTFDPAIKTPAYLLVDSLSVISGHLQLLKINAKEKNPVSYEIIIYGETVDLVKSIGDKLLTDMDFSELNHNRSTKNIESSWTANTSNLGYYYPLVDYSYDLDVTELNSGILSILIDSGDVTVGTSLSLIDTSKSWVTNAFAGYNVNIISGTGAGQSRLIGSNTGVDLNINFFWAVVPDSTSKYTITKQDTSNPYNTTGGGMNPSLFKPALSNAYLTRKIFNNIGFSIEGDFIDSDIFAETIIPYNGIDDLNFNSEDISTFQAYLSAPFEKHPSGTFSTPNLVDFPFTDDNINGSDRSGVYSASTQTYISPAAGTSAKFYVHLSYDYNLTYLPAGESVVDVFYIRYYRSSFSLTSPYHQEVIAVDRCPGFYFMGPAGTVPPPPGSALGPHSITSSASPIITLASGETVWVKIYVANSTNVLYPIYDVNSAFYNRVYTDGVVNNYIEYNNYVPKKIKQIDYIKSIINKFNLMVVPNKHNSKSIKLIPRTEYYASGEIKDWSDKLDNNFPVESTLLSEQQSKTIFFTDKADKDYYNTLYTEDTNKIYGEYTYSIDNEWLDPTSKKVIDTIFSPTPLDKVFGTEDMIIPKISKLESNGTYGKTESNIRFLRKNKTLTPTLNTIKLLGGNIYNGYPYAGHLDDPFNSTIDYNFGTIEYAFYNTPGYENLQSITPNNLINLYWKEYLDDINDKNSRLVKCRMKLSAADIAQFNYNDSIFIDGLSDDGGHYFIVNKITYSPTTETSSVVELIKVSRKPSDEFQRTTIDTNRTAVKRNSIVLGGAVVEAKNSIGIGNGNFISSLSRNSYVNGTNNYVGQLSNGSFLQGDNNLIGDYVYNSNVFGSNNIIGELQPLVSGATATTYTILSGITLLGVNNFTATTSDTVYLQNLHFTSSASTINGSSIQNLSTWTKGEGINSIKANNNTGLHARGNYSLAFGAGTNANGTNSFCGGQSSTAKGDFSFAFGKNSIASGSSTTVLGSDITGTTRDTVYVPNIVIKPTIGIPTGSTDSIGEEGSIVYDANYLYFKNASGWLKVSGYTF